MGLSQAFRLLNGEVKLNILRIVLCVFVIPQPQFFFCTIGQTLHMYNLKICLNSVFCLPSAVKGKTPQVGDRVLVEAVYNPNMPFKWNAQRIQTLPQLANQSVRTFRGCTQLIEDRMTFHIDRLFINSQEIWVT